MVYPELPGIPVFWGPVNKLPYPVNNNLACPWTLIEKLHSDTYMMSRAWWTCNVRSHWKLMQRTTSTYCDICGLVFVYITNQTLRGLFSNNNRNTDWDPEDQRRGGFAGGHVQQGCCGGGVRHCWLCRVDHKNKSRGVGRAQLSGEKKDLLGKEIGRWQD